VRGDDGEGRKIFLGNLAFTSDERYIRECFGKFGDIKDVYLPTDSRGQKRGFGFVTFSDERGAEDAADEMHGAMFDGRKVTCNIARPRPAPGAQRGGGGGYGGGGYRGGGRDYGRRRSPSYEDRRSPPRRRRSPSYDRRRSPSYERR